STGSRSDSLSPHINGDDRFDFKSMVMNIRDDAREVVERFFPSQDEEE
ncbi:relaxosome protein TraM, partial [Enterobacter kobei]